jgi:hypothetical protein
MIKQAFLCAMLSFFAAAPIDAAEPAKVGEAGTYVLLLDEAGKPVAGAYWLSPALKIMVRSRPGGYPTEPVYMDREIFPHRRAVMTYFENVKISYVPDPMEVKIGQVERIVRRTERLGPLAAASPPEELPLKYTFTGLLASTLTGTDLINRFYSIERYDLSEKSDEFGKRIYIETLDMDVSAEEGARVTALSIGKALSSGDFYMDYMIRADIVPKFTRCLREKKALPGYQANAKRQRDGSDALMATDFLTEGCAYWEQKTLPPDGEAMNVYSLCPPN